MIDWEFEKFLLEQVRRERALYSGIMITFVCCGIACIVMAAAALIIFRIEVLGISIKLLLVSLVFAGSSYGSSLIAKQSKTAAEEMAFAIQHPESSDPEEYTEQTKNARRAACRNLHSIRGLIVSYSIIALSLWGATLIIAGLAIEDSQSYEYLFISFITFSMALAMSILAIAYLCDLPAARKYRELIEQGEEEQ